MRAGSSASRMRSWPSLARRLTTRVTAFLGSLVLPLVDRRRAALRVEGTFFLLRFAIVAGLYSNWAKRRCGPDRRQDRHTSKRWRAIALQMRYLAADA